MGVERRKGDSPKVQTASGDISKISPKASQKYRIEEIKPGSETFDRVLDWITAEDDLMYKSMTGESDYAQKSTETESWRLAWRYTHTAMWQLMQAKEKGMPKGLHFCVMLDESRNPVGFQSFVLPPNKDTNQIMTTYVNPSERRVGIAKRLTDHCVEESRRQNCLKVETHVHEFSVDAIESIEKQGFREVKREEGDITYRLDLKEPKRLTPPNPPSP
ncbi:GNAT family N-acetyltransferase [Candidatus Altiarchaeota archaeon]